MIKDERHRYGRHYTPHSVAELLAALVVRTPDDRVFDPSCGDGRLLRAALERKLQLARDRRRSVDALELRGIDLTTAKIVPELAGGATISQGDFFELRPGLNFVSDFDGIIGNPPYIRQEVMGAGDKSRIASLIEEQRLASPGIFWPRFSGRSDIYVFFFAHAISFLRNGGRLVFLTSASWLDSGYGEALREFFLKNFRILAILESGVEDFFEGASIKTVVTVLEREVDDEKRRNARVRFVQLLKRIDQNGTRIADSILENDSSCRTSEYKCRVVTQRDLISGSGGWGKYLRAEDLFFEVIGRGVRMTPLRSVARVRFGVKTGANDFFYLHERSESDSGLKRLGDVASVRRGLTTGANEFFYVKRRDREPIRAPHAVNVRDSAGTDFLIEPEYLSPVVFSLRELSAIKLSRLAGSKLFFDCQMNKRELEGTRALAYIERGERAGYHLRPTCAGRTPWYWVTRGMRPAPLLFPSKVGERWLVALNRARAFEDKKLYGIFPQPGVDLKVLAALLNSTWARYYVELTCRQMTGAQAIADIDVAVAEQVLIPDPRSVPSGLALRLGRALETLSNRRVLSASDEANCADRRSLDLLTLEAIGFSSAPRAERLLERLYAAVIELVRRRAAGSRNK